MTVTIDGRAKRIGLTLSGGGFRAAAFHLGVFRKLEVLGLLRDIDLLSCVSGGSIAGAVLALNWGDGDVLDRLEAYLKENSIAVSSFLEGLFHPFQTRLDRLAGEYDDELFFKRPLSDLKNGPRIYFGATNLATGNYFFFVAGGGGKEELGEHELGVHEDPNFLISHAVAASSAFPPVFPPLRLNKDEYPPGRKVGYVTLTDGGVYDNLGINPTLRDRNKLDYVIVSDGGKPFEIDTNPTESGSLVVAHSLGIMMEQIRGLEFQRLELQHKSGRGPKPLWFSIDSTEGEAEPGDAKKASSIGTNLKALKDDEIETLGRHGGALVEARLKKYAPELLQG